LPAKKNGQSWYSRAMQRRCLKPVANIAIAPSYCDRAKPLPRRHALDHSIAWLFIAWLFDDPARSFAPSAEGGRNRLLQILREQVFEKQALALVSPQFQQYG
jgi:hypothetical protein